MALPVVDVTSPILNAFLNAQSNARANRALADKEQQDLLDRQERAKQFEQQVKQAETLNKLRQAEFDSKQASQNFLEKTAILNLINSGALENPSKMMDQIKQNQQFAPESIAQPLPTEINVMGKTFNPGEIPSITKMDRDMEQRDFENRLKELTLEQAGRIADAKLKADYAKQNAQFAFTAREGKANRESREKVARERMIAQAARDAAKENKDTFGPAEKESIAKGQLTFNDGKHKLLAAKQLGDYDWGDGNVGAVALTPDQFKAIKDLSSSARMHRDYLELREALKRKDWYLAYDLSKSIQSTAASLKNMYPGLGVLSDQEQKMLGQNLPSNPFAEFNAAAGNFVPIDRIINRLRDSHIRSVNDVLNVPLGQKKFLIREHRIDIPKFVTGGK